MAIFLNPVNSIILIFLDHLAVIREVTLAKGISNGSLYCSQLSLPLSDLVDGTEVFPYRIDVMF